MLRAQQQTTADNSLRNQTEQGIAFGPCRTVLYPVHGQSHGQFDSLSCDEIFRLAVLATSSLWRVQLCGGLDPCLALVAEERKSPSAVALDWRVVLPFGLGIHAHLAARQPISLLPNNQIESRAHDCGFALSEDHATTKCYCVVPSASAYLPDVPQQIADYVDVAENIRDGNRELGSGGHGSRAANSLNCNACNCAWSPIRGFKAQAWR